MLNYNVNYIKLGACQSLLIKKGVAKKGDGKDVDHKNRNPTNNSPNN